MSKVQEVLWSGEGVPTLRINDWEEDMEIGRRCEAGMGSLEFRRTQKGPHIVRFTANGKFKFAVMLRNPGRYILHSDFGYRKKDIEEMTPLERILDKFKVSKKAVCSVSWEGPTPVRRDSKNSLRAYPEGASERKFESDGEFEVSHHDSWPIFGGRFSEGYAEGLVSPGTFLVDYDRKVLLGGSIGIKISQIFLKDESHETLESLEKAISSLD